jgi:hypothetical protein
MQSTEAVFEDSGLKDVQSEDMQSEDMQSEDMQSEDMQSEDMQSVHVQSEDVQQELAQPTGPLLTKRGLPMRQSALQVSARVADILVWEQASENSKLVRDVAEAFDGEFQNEAENKRRRVTYQQPDSDSEVELGDTDDEEDESSILDSGSEDHDFNDATLQSASDEQESEEPESEEEESEEEESDEEDSDEEEFEGKESEEDESEEYESEEEKSAEEESAAFIIANPEAGSFLCDITNDIADDMPDERELSQLEQIEVDNFFAE